jgi:hypothetical protein
VKQTLIELKREMDNKRKVAGNLNTSLSTMDRATRRTANIKEL